MAIKPLSLGKTILIRLLQPVIKTLLSGKKLWALKTIPRHKNFLWRVINNSLPLRSELGKRGIQCSPLCPHCNSKIEDINHAFMTCSYITRVWYGSQLNINIDKSPITNFSVWISYAIEHYEPDITIQIAALTYHIWFDRNQRVFEDKRIPEEDIIHRAANSIHDFHEAHLPQNAEATLACYSGYSSKPKRVTTWKKPTDNLVKMNSDANLQVDGW